MKKYLILIALLALACCGRNQTKLRTELKSIEAEMAQVASSARNCQEAMNQSGADSFIGSFAAGYGAVSGDSQTALDGVASAVASGSQYESARSAFEQLQQRYEALSKIRSEILRQLH